MANEAQINRAARAFSVGCTDDQVMDLLIDVAEMPEDDAFLCMVAARILLRDREEAEVSPCTW